jgi:hypothetical protein
MFLLLFPVAVETVRHETELTLKTGDFFEAPGA